MTHTFSFCESVHASGKSPWHIRQLTDAGRKLGGGIDTASLCEHVKAHQGWDLDVEITEHHLGHSCSKCVNTYREATMTEENIDLSKLNSRQFDVLSQFCLGNNLGHNLTIVEQLLETGLVEARIDAETKEPVPTVPTPVHMAWASHCSQMTEAIEALPDTLRVITLWQPWASLIAFGAKRIETRGWETQHRGPLVIHAAKRFMKPEQDLCQQEPFRSALQGLGPKDLPLGKALCVVDLTKIDPTSRVVVNSHSNHDWEQERHFGDYAAGRFAWFLNNLRPLPEPVPLTGRQSIWTVGKEQLTAAWTI